MIRLGLIGDPVAHSRSPGIVRGLLEAKGIDGAYDLLPTRREDLVERLDQVREAGYHGLNVTSPLKQEVVGLLDDLTDVAGRLGAVNTIRFEGNGTIGTNTDVEGFSRSLDDHPLLVDRFTAAVLGTGGAARAAVAALLGYDQLDRLTVISRRQDRAEALGRIWSDPRLQCFGSDDANEGEHPLATADLIVNATPIGMAGTEGMPIAPTIRLRCRLLYDMIYDPDPTLLMQRAVESGAETIGGHRMLEEQAAAAVRFWFEEPGSMTPDG